MPVCGESREVREETVESWKEGLPVILADYSPQDIFNIDETGKFFRALPTKTLSERRKKVYWWQAVKRETDLVLSRARKI